MSGTGWKLAKYTVIVGATVGLVGCFAGTDSTINMTHTAVAGTAWGVGVAGGAAKEAGPAFKAGFAGSSGGSQTFSDPQLNTKAQMLKVPNCSKAQKKAAPAACA